MTFCETCFLADICKTEKMSCNAFDAIYKIHKESDRETKTQLIHDYAKQLNFISYEVSEELRQLGEKIISHMPELFFIKEFEIRIGYVVSYESKKSGNKAIAADCRKVTSAYTAYLPLDFIVTFYEPNISYMTENQKKILILHELKHIGIGPKGLRVEPHDIEDFEDLLNRYGLNWNGVDGDVPDILLAGGDDGEKDSKKSGRKWHKMATKPTTSRNGGNACKS